VEALSSLKKPVYSTYSVCQGRPWRIEYEGGLYHVLSLGNERKEIFRDDEDRQLFLDTIGDMVERYAVFFKPKINTRLTG